MALITSPKMQKYFEKIEDNVSKIYKFAEEARSIGIDPENFVESPQARDMAGRVEKLVGPTGIADQIRTWKKNGMNQDAICFHAMDQILEGKLGNFSKEIAVDRAIRTALAIKTEGVVSAPLEGIAKIIIRENVLGGDPYLAIYFAGPIRAAGGTVQAFAVLCAEHVRQKMNIAPWKATEDEVGRMVEEVKMYDRILNLQYPSTKKELDFAVRHLTVELNGDPTESQEVSAHRDLPRIDSNRIRGGPCLVLNDGVLLKSKKILRIIDQMGIEGWDWLRELKELAHADNKSKTENEDKDKAKDYGGDTYKGKKKVEEELLTTEINDNSPVAKRKAKLDEKNPPLNKFIADVIAGRPVFAYPSRVGGHRIRYGHSRNTGLAACGTHPSQMILLEKYMAIGTQIRIERPGKSASTMPVTSIEPPIVLMGDGEVKQLWDMKEAKNIADNRLAKRILFLGDMLFGYGEFVENNHTILPSGYVEEWWGVELEDKLKKLQNNGEDPFQNLSKCLSKEKINEFTANVFDNIPTGLQALELSNRYQVGIHPRYLDHWGNINGTDLLIIRSSFAEGLRSFFKIPNDSPLSFTNYSWDEMEKSILASGGIKFQDINGIKTMLENAFVVHKYDKENQIIQLDPHRSILFIEMLGFGKTSKFIKTPSPSLSTSSPSSTPSVSLEEIPDAVMQLSEEKTALDLFPFLTTLIVHDKAPYYMGSRMGRPEKAKERRMNPPVQCLFPIGHDSKLARSFSKAETRSSIEIEICQKVCPNCGTVTFLNQCPNCDTHTEFKKVCPQCHKIYPKKEIECPQCHRNLISSSMQKVPFKRFFEKAKSHIPKTIPDIKGVKGMMSEFKVPEPIEKGILRAINGVWVYKDGTIRADATDIPLTHFTCHDIGTSVEKIRQLGYDLDVYGAEIKDEYQIIELYVQDVLLTDHVADYFINVANFVDDELEYIYHKPRFYKVKKREDLIGQYMAGLAPHTSAAIVGRLIGFTRAESGYAHPYWHAAKRRNCDGDEDGIMLLLEMLLNFSMHYLPSSLGGKMDAPLVCSLLLDPLEVDGESHHVDYMPKYPLRFYLDTQNYPKPAKLREYMILYKDKLNTPAQYEGAMFTHPTSSINLGPKKSAYSLFETMNDKLDSQMYLAKTIDAVDAPDVARKIIGSHFTPDVLGNLRAFSTQGFRCQKCGSKYRRMPLMGKCTQCGNDLLMTVHAGGITKYLSKAQSFITEFNLGAYTDQRWKLIDKNITSLTNNPRVKQKSLKSFFK
ncbi:MAG: DNA polymerase II large subunit [Promethearchaeota archaeon]